MYAIRSYYALAESLWRIAREDEVFVEVEFLPVVPNQDGQNRRELARLCENLIRGDGAVDDIAPGSDARLPV